MNIADEALAKHEARMEDLIDRMLAGNDGDSFTGYECMLALKHQALKSNASGWALGFEQAVGLTGGKVEHEF